MSGAQNGDGLIDAVLLVSFKVLHPAFFDELDDPARIEIDAEADSAAKLAEVFDGQSQSARTGRAQHEPVGALGKIFVRKRFAEHFVVDPVIFGDYPAL